ncbi:MAG TPA: glycine cleavage system protein GcvH [Bacteroidales bacterium]|jgi:glycine cleavage system H protein|nr:glycine cleavage system protein GcvH [Bacteroidales bacterium]HNV95379.1 glycine cleavage system protein GcvH [Bacteroidales bacterium]HOU97257.1 glycine cleavage system protein GcvH [Bacteroidales bacterium]
MNIPANLKYTKDHEWIRKEGNIGYVGVTDFAQGELGDVVFVEIETVGENLSKGEAFGTIEAVKTVSDSYMPVSGKVIEKNEKLDSNPDLINKDPYGEGWMIKIEITNESEYNELLTPEQYQAQLG